MAGQNDTSEAGAVWRSPLVARYGRPEMARLFGARHRAGVWRRLWLALAESERELGLPISEAQIEQLRVHLDDVDLERVAELERTLRHDVMAHIHHLGEQAPLARPIIHLGATSCFVTDNADLIIVRQALGVLGQALLEAIAALGRFARRECDTPCLGYTHLQPAQPTTVGKRAAVWLYELLEAYREIERVRTTLPFRGVKGTTGTQASFLRLFEGDHERVLELERRVAERMGFTASVPVCGQTYPRLWDHRILSALTLQAAVTSRFGVDVRLLQHMGELEEPFGRAQVGSSAMAHKRNPILSERLGALARWLIQIAGNAPHTAAVQWLERSLDDSANRRLALPEALLAAHALAHYQGVIAAGLVVHRRVVAERLEAELPYLALEAIVLEAVRRGGDRQTLHEAARRHAMASRARQRREGGVPDLLDRIAADPLFAAIGSDLPALLEPARHVGRAPEQTRALLREHVEPLLAAHGMDLDAAGDAPALPI
ncbi:MAG: adenylosuccinate lyase [Planctomycetota bacterium]|nr:MAG: adenylosuccinate lyase [Planctomycetota bacterium]